MPRPRPITSKDQVPAELHPIVDEVIAVHGPLQGPYSGFLHVPELARRLSPAGGYIRFETQLDNRLKNLAALTTAREFDCAYVWGAQSGAARRGGIPEATIDAIRAKTTDGIPADDAQVVAFTQTLIRKHRVPDAMVEALNDFLVHGRGIRLGEGEARAALTAALQVKP